MTNSINRYLTAYFVVFGALVFSGISFVLYMDPYALYRANPIELANSASDLRMRFVKGAQVVFRHTNLILLGSSTVYRGLDPSMLVGVRAYNAGVSSLRMREVVHYVNHIQMVTSADRIILGLEFFMFDGAVQTESGFDPRLGTLEGALMHSIGAIFSRQAILDAWRQLRTHDRDKDGVWFPNGFKQTNPRSQDQNSSQLERAKSFYQKVNALLDEPYEDLRIVIRSCQARGIRMQLFFTPSHRSYVNVIEQAGRGEQYRLWRRRVTEIVGEEGGELYDMAIENPAIDVLLAGSNLHYIDPSHYSTAQGAAILAALGLQIDDNTNALVETLGLHRIGKRLQ